ncbi:LysE family translocator [Candidatus Halobeggiatoa sp. HSG11]|nr:LysE family translocator [Candidatus Halobeggiatoa sp. HSG11]
MIAMLMILATITFVAMMSPGPDMMLVVKYGCTRERWPVVACIVGICCGLTVHVTLSILGIAAVIAASATIYSIIKLAGAGYIIYIGFKSLISEGELNLDDTENKSKNFATPFRDGFLCNILNPKVTLYILAVFTQVVEPSTPVFDKIIYGFLIVFEAFVVWNFFVSFIRIKLVLRQIQRFQVIIDRVVGVMLIGFGGLLVLK